MFVQFPVLACTLLATSVWLSTGYERHAFAADSKSCLAVLYNQNKMVNEFRASSWVTEIKGFDCLSRCYHLRWDDCWYCHSRSDESELPNGWSQGELPSAASRRAADPARRSVWPSHRCTHQSQVLVCHHATGYEKACWSSHRRLRKLWKTLLTIKFLQVKAWWVRE